MVGVVADPYNLVVNGNERGQVLAFFAVLLPIVLLPLVAYAIDAAFVVSHAAGLQAAATQAAEVAAEQVNVDALRMRSELSVNASSARAIAIQAMSGLEPGAVVESVAVNGAEVSVVAHELVTLPFNFLPAKAVQLDARVSARLVAGYDRPSSRVALPTSTF